MVSVFFVNNKCLCSVTEFFFEAVFCVPQTERLFVLSARSASKIRNKMSDHKSKKNIAQFNGKDYCKDYGVEDADEVPSKKSQITRCHRWSRSEKSE